MEMTVFNFENRKFRTQVDSNGRPLWVVRDVCEILGLENTSKALKNHPRDEITNVHDVDRQGRIVNVLAVSEAGLYRLIFKSRKDEAEKFRKFVFEVVLPNIRETGTFSVRLNEKAKVYPVAEPVFKALKSVALEFGLVGNQAVLFANKATKRETGVDFQSILQIELKNEKQQVMLTPTEIGKRLQISAQQVNKLLSEKGYQNKIDGKWIVTETGKQYAEILDVGKAHSDGTPIQQIKWYESVLETELKAS